MLTAYADVVLGLEIVFAITGLVLLWRLVISPRARVNPTASPLPAWEAEPIEFLLLLLLIMLGSFAAGTVTAMLLKRAAVTGDSLTILGGAAAQVGMLLGVLAFAARSPHFRMQAKPSLKAVLVSGVATFLVSLPILNATSKAWEVLLNLLGVPAPRQDLIRIFAEAKSPILIIVLTGLATIVAPITEELVFRAGLFRFLRTRAPRFLALLVPALIFASLHVTDWKTLSGFASFGPLLVLALLFSVAYERTGHIGTTIVAHGLFNLNTIVLIFAGLGT